MSPHDRTIVEICGTIDGRFWPLRSMREQGPMVATWQARREYLTGGIEMVAAGGDAAQRKTAQRRRQDLRRAGLIKIGRTQKRSVGVKLTDKADDRARRLVGVPTLGQVFSLVKDILLLARQPKTDRLICTWECSIADLEYAPDGCSGGFDDLAQKLLPTLTRGWIASHADCFGHVAYFAGTRADEMPARPPEVDGSEVEPIEEAVSVYFDAFDAERERLAASTPDDGREIVIPLSTGFWPRTKFSKTAPTREEWELAKGLR